MNSRASLLLAPIIAIAAPAFASDQPLVKIRVKQDGQMCEVLSQITECASLPQVLAQEFGADRDVPLSVSPEGCGESAIGLIRVVVDKLKAAGYFQVTVVGGLSEPNNKCSSR